MPSLGTASPRQAMLYATERQLGHRNFRNEIRLQGPIFPSHLPTSSSRGVLEGIQGFRDMILVGEVAEAQQDSALLVNHKRLPARDDKKVLLHA